MLYEFRYICDIYKILDFLDKNAKKVWFYWALE